MVELKITKFEHLVEKVIPFFEKYGIKGQKSLDFEDFKKIAQMIKNKDHLKLEGFNQIIQINSNMNQRRP